MNIESRKLMKWYKEEMTKGNYEKARRIWRVLNKLIDRR